MKKWFESKSIWMGLFTTTISVLAFLQGEEWIKNYPNIVAGLGTAIGILTIYLRYITEKPMEMAKRLKQKPPGT